MRLPFLAKDEHITLFKPLNLSFQIKREASYFGCVSFLGLLLEIIRVGHRGEVAAIRYGIEILCVEVVEINGVTLRDEGLLRLSRQRAAKAFWFVMSVNDEDLHDVAKFIVSDVA